MNLGQDAISQLISALPRNFDFYDLGNVELSPTPETGGTETAETPEFSKLLEDHHAIAFSFRGELKALMVVTFDKGLDLSTYSELGNILASRLAMRLYDDSGVDVLLSPPQTLSATQIEILPRLGSLIAQRTYRHFDRGQIVTINTFLLANAASTEEHGNA
ncbi:MAG TPA: hypothetical protein DCS07_14730 [Bdellovibrionales bacterium]|nr:MAG: hypothetical protein A2X97_03035 [Bdellovibrionales bacterium GWA1_52_35]OFZ39943.1 MAG: hypothetical protein A2070_07810 [Bdellovibrionales bacterium GWC1_52_8]HAR43866.1 hypothetical protein [Bdellovibrionales bacterium]HCM40167.1 hypothetical protein [Bdellovibrionales bacterium]